MFHLSLLHVLLILFNYGVAAAARRCTFRKVAETLVLFLYPMMDTNGERAVENNIVDRLGNLPEEVICRVMSVLPVEDAVRTEALSKKWRYRWTKMTNLAFYDNFLPSRKKCSKEDFMIFFERVLILLGNQVIESFSLECLKQYDAARVHTWITALVRRDVQKLKVYCSPKGSLAFDACLFDRKPLTEMHLMVPCKFKVPTSCCFSSMKILCLCQVTFLNTSFSQARLLNISLPLLEELSLWGCSWENVRCVNIDAPVLNRFSVGDFEYYYDNKLCRVVRHVRKVQQSSFIINSKDETVSNDQCIAFVSPSSISDASIELSTRYLRGEHRMGVLFRGLLKQFSSLKSLTLSRDTIIVLAPLWTIRENLPHLHSTLHLTISGGSPVHCESLINLLLHLPCLESLTVCKGNPYFEADCLRGIYKECPLPLLKEVEFSAIAGRKDELELAKFIVKNATALKKLTIIARGSKQNGERNIMAARGELLHFPRASARASIEFHQIPA